MKTGLWRRLALALVLAGVFAAPVRADDVLKDSAAALDRGEAAAVYARLAPLESERAGDPVFDLLLGIAAIDSGQPTRAVFALERVVMIQPGNARAHAELARAYAVLGEKDAAKAEMARVDRSQVSKEVSAALDRFLDQVDRSGTELRLTGHVGLELGYDSNVNGGPDDRLIAIPAFGGLVMELSPTSVELDDTVSRLFGGVNVVKPLAPRIDLIAGLDAYRRFNADYGQYETGGWDGRAGVQFRNGANRLALTAQMGDMSLNGGDYREYWGFSGQFIKPLNERSQLSTFAQFSRIEFPTQRSRDVDRVVMGAAYASLSQNGRFSWYGSGYFGRERERKANVAGVGNILWGGRAGVEMPLQWRDPVALFASAAYESRHYRGQDASFLVRREDDQFNFSAGLRWTPWPNWSVTPQWSYTYNDSNIAINKYDRHVVSVTARHDF